ncbi:hypothetical protein OHB19_26830 [Streptomyces sp. NBC_00893]|nr:hypothetical protein [Streptomyces sp. NBC_00893]MCX4848913.1 hypothetical protein [Streptomyces sp. NBC_00893]
MAGHPQQREQIAAVVGGEENTAVEPGDADRADPPVARPFQFLQMHALARVELGNTQAPEPLDRFVHLFLHGALEGDEVRDEVVDEGEPGHGRPQGAAVGGRSTE